MADSSVHLNISAASAVIIAILIAKKRRKRRNRKIWVREWILNRPYQGAYHHLLRELQLGDQVAYKHFLRMDVYSFECILDKVRPMITYKDTHMRKAVPPGERLALTLRFLATGESYSSIQYLYRIPSQTIGKIVIETCNAIIEALNEDYLKVPRTQSEWKEIATQFHEQWNFPHCIGALDGKHINIRPPPSSGSYYYNYKQRFSIVLLALVDANYKFVYVDIGCNGRVSDGGVFRESSLSSALEKNTLNIPPSEPLPGCSIPIPYTIVADAAFPLKDYIQKPYSQIGLTIRRRIYNYRLSRARRIVENAFGILANRFRVLMTPINLAPEKVEIITFTCCLLHNYLRSKTEACNVYTPPGSLDSEHPLTHEVHPGKWRGERHSNSFTKLKQQGSNHTKETSKLYRQYMTDYFNSPLGAVSWQNNMI